MARPNDKMKALAAQLNGDVAEPKSYGEGKLGLIRGLNFYAANREMKDSKKWAIEWAKTNAKDIHAKLNGVKDFRFGNTGFICRMISRGWTADTDVLERVIDKLTQLSKIKEETVAASPVAPKPKVVRKQHYVNTSMCSLDDQLENAMAGLAIGKFEFTHTIKKDLDQVVEYCKRTLKEMNDVREAYHVETIHKIRPVLKSAMAEAETLLAHIEKNKTKVAASAPKKINPANMVKTVKHLKEIPEYKVKGVPLTSVVSAKKVYAYDHKLRLLMMFVSTDAAGLLFSGTTIKNYDVKKSVRKTVRKPEALFAQIEKDGGGIAAYNKVFAGLTTTEAPVASGRTNDNMIFLKVSS